MIRISETLFKRNPTIYSHIFYIYIEYIDFFVIRPPSTRHRGKK